MNSRPDYEQESENYKQGTVGNINYIYQRVSFTHYIFDFGSVNYARNPKDNTDNQSKEHQY
ncbi:hypothetical protein ACFLZ5_04705 [Thermodesulfobacteriota bacterium]